MSPIVSVLVFFSDAQGQFTPQSMVGTGRISNASETFRSVVLITCKNEKLPIKNEGARVFKNIIHQLFRHSRADKSGVDGGIWPKFELVQAFMHILVTCKNEDDSMKNEGAIVVPTFSQISLWDFFSDAQGQLTPQFLVRSGRISNSFEM